MQASIFVTKNSSHLFCLYIAFERKGDGGDQPKCNRPYEEPAGRVSQATPAKQIK